MDFTGNKWIDLLIVFVSAGGILKASETVYKILSAKFEWRKQSASTKSAELDAIKKEAETLEFLEMRLKAVHSELEESRNKIEDISEKSRKEIRDITNRSLGQLDAVDRRATEQWYRMKEMRDRTLTLLAEADEKNPHN